MVALPSLPENPLDLKVFFSGFADQYKKLISEEPVTCAHTGNTFAGVSAPHAAIVDVSGVPVMLLSRPGL